MKLLSRMTEILILVMKNSPMKLKQISIPKTIKLNGDKDVFHVTPAYEDMSSYKDVSCFSDLKYIL